MILKMYVMDVRIFIILFSNNNYAKKIEGNCELSWTKYSPWTQPNSWTHMYWSLDDSPCILKHFSVDGQICVVDVAGTKRINGEDSSVNCKFYNYKCTFLFFDCIYIFYFMNILLICPYKYGDTIEFCIFPLFVKRFKYKWYWRWNY